MLQEDFDEMLVEHMAAALVQAWKKVKEEEEVGSETGSVVPPWRQEGRGTAKGSAGDGGQGRWWKRVHFEDEAKGGGGKGSEAAPAGGAGDGGKGAAPPAGDGGKGGWDGYGGGSVWDDVGASDPWEGWWNQTPGWWSGGYGGGGGAAPQLPLEWKKLSFFILVLI